MAEAKRFLWYYGYGSEPDVYHGAFTTRDQAIAEGRATSGSDPFAIVEAQKGSFAMMDASDLLEALVDRWSDDDFGADESPEFGGKPEDVSAAVAELDALLAGWFEKHTKLMPEPWSFAETRNSEVFNAEPEGES